MTDFSEFGTREKVGWADGGIVSAYIEHFVPITNAAGRAIVQNQVSADDEVLDLCCGQATLTAALADAASRVVGLDFSPEMVRIARERVPEVEIVEGDAMAMPFADARFDKVVCNFGMTHIPDQHKALTEIRRVLRPGGEFIMATWMSPDASPAFAAVFSAIKAYADFSAAPSAPDLFVFADPKQSTAMMAQAGLEFRKQDVVESAWVLKSPADLFEIFLTATVGARMLIRSQTQETISQIAADVENTVRENYAEGSGYRVPVTVAVNAAKAA